MQYKFIYPYIYIYIYIYILEYQDFFLAYTIYFFANSTQQNESIFFNIKKYSDNNNPNELELT
jgi:hypothetical protein